MMLRNQCDMYIGISHPEKFHCRGMEEMTLQGTLLDLCLHTLGRESEVGSGPGRG